MSLPKFKLYANFKITDQCELICNGCELSPSPPQSLEKNDLLATPSPQVERGTGGGAKIVNICGGDPLLEPDLAKIILKLKEKKHWVALTTNGINLNHLNPEIFRFIDLPIIYLPGTDDKSVRRETGFDCFNKIKSGVEYLEELKKKHLINFPVTPITVELIPDLITLFEKNKKTYIWLNYQPNVYGEISKDSKKYLKHYAKRKNVLVYQERNSHTPGSCLGLNYPLEKLNIRNLLFFIKLFYKIYM